MSVGRGAGEVTKLRLISRLHTFGCRKSKQPESLSGCKVRNTDYLQRCSNILILSFIFWEKPLIFKNRHSFLSCRKVGGIVRVLALSYELIVEIISQRGEFGNNENTFHILHNISPPKVSIELHRLQSSENNILAFFCSQHRTLYANQKESSQRNLEQILVLSDECTVHSPWLLPIWGAITKYQKLGA